MNDDRNLTVDRVRHPLKMRLLKVLRTHRVSPQLLRVTLGGEDLADFVSGSFDDHIKVFSRPRVRKSLRCQKWGLTASVFRKGSPGQRHATTRPADTTTQPASSTSSSCCMATGQLPPGRRKRSRASISAWAAHAVRS